MTHKSKLLALAVALMACSIAIAHPYVPGAKQSGPVLLKGGKVYTVSHGVLDNADVLFEGGRITQIGPNLTAPAGSEVIDVTGQCVYPGLINAHTVLGLTEIGAVKASNDIDEVGQNNPDVVAHVAYNLTQKFCPPSVPTASRPRWSCPAARCCKAAPA